MQFRFAILVTFFLASSARASPTLPLDDPAYERLAILRAQGRLPLYLGGIRPLTEVDAERLLLQAGELPDPALRSPARAGLWVDPAHRVAARFGLFSDETRPYSTAALERRVSGGVALSCEHQEGRPCGGGYGGLLELDSAAGYGPWLSAFMRLQLMAGSNQWEIRGQLDRIYINGQWGPVALLIGRDVLVLGPGVHTQLIWGDHPAPLDHVRIQTAHPIKIPRLPVTLSALYAVGRFRDPQAHHGALVTLTRLELAFADQFSLGAQQLLQIGGDGPIHYGFGDFLGEHFTRTGNHRGVGGSNRRDSFDLVYTNKWARGLRLYYELAFEDFRKRLGDMFLYDCDHLVGLDLPGLTAAGKHGITVELQHNGPFAQDHYYFTNGLTQAGRTVGSPLGPDSWSLYAGARLDLPHVTLWPWLEWARLSSDRYQAPENAPIVRAAIGVAESRWRIGVKARARLPYGFRIEPRVLYEHVDNFAFTVGATRDQGGAAVDLIWTSPRGHVRPAE